MAEFERQKIGTSDRCFASLEKSNQVALRPARVENPVPAPQQAPGNQAAQRFAQSCPLALPSPGLCPFGGVCHACPARVQTKLKINEPGDQYEQEADRVAEQVMRMPERGVVWGACSPIQAVPQRACPGCAEQVQRQVEPEEEEEEEPIQTKSLTDEIAPLVQRQGEEEEEEETQTKSIPDAQRQEEEPEEEEEEPLQAKETAGAEPQAAPTLEARIRALQGEGQPLPSSERTFFEPRFGHDFSRVRVHTGLQAAAAARAVRARAFTTGQDIVFGAGQYTSGTSTGRRLLAHELTHVVQQRGRNAMGKTKETPPRNAATSDVDLSTQARRPDMRTDRDKADAMYSEAQSPSISRNGVGLERAYGFHIQRKSRGASCPAWKRGRRIIREAERRFADPKVNYAYHKRIPWVFCPNPSYTPRYPYPPAMSKSELARKIREWQRQNPRRRSVPVQAYLAAWRTKGRRHLGRALQHFPTNERVIYWGHRNLDKCHIFVFNVLYKAGLPGRDLVARNGRYYSARNLWKFTHLRNYLRVIPKTTCQIKGGDIFVTSWGHTGIVTSYRPNGLILTIEYWRGLERKKRWDGSDFKFFRVIK